VTASGTGIGGATTAAGKLDVDKVHELDGVPIYDADIASMTVGSQELSFWRQFEFLCDVGEAVAQAGRRHHRLLQLRLQ